MKLGNPFAGTFSMLRQTVSEWIADGAFRMAAGLAYFTVFSIGPLLMVSIGVAGLIYGEEAVDGAVADQLTAMAAVVGDYLPKIGWPAKASIVEPVAHGKEHRHGWLQNRAEPHRAANAIG